LDSPFLSGWDDLEVVTERLGTALDDTQSSGTSSTRIESAVCESLADHSGLSGDLKLLTLTLSSENENSAKNEIKLLIKQSMPGEKKAKSSKAFGKYREAYMYSTIGPWLRERLGAQSDCSFIPQAHYAVADPCVGQYSVVTDYYDGSIEAGLFYPKSIHNSSNEKRRTKTLPASISRQDVTLEAVRVAAKIHGCFFLDETLLNSGRISKHLRMTDWIRGNGRDSFLASQQMIQNGWSSAKLKHEKGEHDIAMKQKFIEVMDTSVGQALDFDAFVSKWSGAGEGKLPFTLVHGDFHPGNLLVTASSVENGKAELILVDWEAVGVGSGPQDLGQFLISHSDAAEAVDMLDRITSLYRKTLVDTIAETNPSLVGSVPSAESTRREIIYGGLERWVWLFSVMCNMPIPSNYMQYFHDQMYDWIVLNDVTSESIGMPRS